MFGASFLCLVPPSPAFNTPWSSPISSRSSHHLPHYTYPANLPKGGGPYSPFCCMRGHHGVCGGSSELHCYAYFWTGICDAGLANVFHPQSTSSISGNTAWDRVVMLCFGRLGLICLGTELLLLSVPGCETSSPTLQWHQPCRFIGVKSKLFLFF